LCCFWWEPGTPGLQEEMLEIPISVFDQVVQQFRQSSCTFQKLNTTMWDFEMIVEERRCGGFRKVEVKDLILTSTEFY
jgi:hypothetical protein